MEKLGFLTGRKTTPVIYSTWTAMRHRCQSKKCKEYKNYGGRGIEICERWNKFEHFYADMGDKPKGMTLERKNNNLGYSPDNCKWATRMEQANNMRKTKLLEFNGERLSVSAWARRLGISRKTVHARIQLGYPDNMVLDAGADYRIGNKCILDV